MNQRGGCCIARYAGGAYNNYTSKVDRIMLRFRPIAPKPAATVSNFSMPENGETLCVKTGRGKRKHAVSRDSFAVNKRCVSRKTMKASPCKNPDAGRSVSGGEEEVKTLAFLPETAVVKKSLKKDQGLDSFPVWLSFGDGGHVSPATGHVTPESWVKVECVTETWVAEGNTDEERVRSLDADTCPGFVSDGQNRVRWTNGAYKKMVGGEGVWLVVEAGVALPVGSGFTCRVRVVTCVGKEKRCKTVPCDVWRMDCGWFVWRLDTAAALSLGR